jgi:hypothetical protein
MPEQCRDPQHIDQIPTGKSPMKLTHRIHALTRNTRCYAAAAAWLSVAATPLAFAGPPIDGQVRCGGVTTSQEAEWVAEQLLAQGAYARAGQCYEAAGDFRHANVAFLKAAEAESDAAERRLSAQSDQAKALFRQVQQGFR